MDIPPVWQPGNYWIWYYVQTEHQSHCATATALYCTREEGLGVAPDHEPLRKASGKRGCCWWLLNFTFFFLIFLKSILTDTILSLFDLLRQTTGAHHFQCVSSSSWVSFSNPSPQPLLLFILLLKQALGQHQSTGELVSLVIRDPGGLKPSLPTNKVASK